MATTRTYTSRFGVLQSGTAGTFTLYVARQGLRAIVRDVVWWISGSAASLHIYVQTGTAAYSLVQEVQKDDLVHHLELRQALADGDQLLAVTAGTGAWQVAVTGYELVDEGSGTVGNVIKV